MRYLKQNTATRVTVGPFLDVTDAKTPEVALTATNEKITFVVDDGGVPTLVIDTTATASGGNNDMVHITNDDAGYYDLELTAAQTNYVGRAMLSINYVTDHLPVFHEFMILPANVFDSWMGTDKLDVNAAELGGTTQTGRDIGTSVLLSSGTGTGQVSLSSGRVDANTTYIAGSAVSTSSAQLGVNVVNAGGTAWGSGAITSGAFATGAITAGAIAADAIGASELAADAVTEIVNAIKAAVIETNGSVTLQQAVSVMLAALAGVTSSGGTVLKDPSGTATRITATIDGSNNRTAMTITPSS